ncbi:serum amyloid P-component-like [Scleropages formosus]|uniref:Pentraxin family member n=1 Tax=Scleropages formosus TaxID=113540 RepID=A0A8C9RB62_SCLFO|nr:serum amyloid P-component-like [Scleropages formosus]
MFGVPRMKPLAVFLTLLASSLAVPKDLTGRMFVFPVLSDTAHARLVPAVDKILYNITVCLRFFSDESKEQSLFSLATPTEHHGLYLYQVADGGYHLYVWGQLATFPALPYERNQWNSICATWDSSAGLTQLWVNGVASPKKALRAGESIAGTPIVVLGQDQDSYGGTFNTADAFVGHITDVHMWDYRLSPCEIQSYTGNLLFMPGNYLNWQALEFTRHGYVVVEHRDRANGI